MLDFPVEQRLQEAVSRGERANLAYRILRRWYYKKAVAKLGR